MVRDAYSAGGQQPHQSDGSTTQGQPLDLRGNSANLTQELAHLLAASIAQGQTGKRAGTPTGAELASLAALVSSASQNQRGVAPGFKDGLSSLSYAPAPPSANPAPVQMTEHHHDDEPMPIPSTWRQPTGSDDDRWFRQQIGAAGLGLVAGLLVVVPAVFWLSGWIGGPQTKSARQPGPRRHGRPHQAPADIKPVKVQVRPVEKTESAAQYVAAVVETRAVSRRGPRRSSSRLPRLSRCPSLGWSSRRGRKRKISWPRPSAGSTAGTSRERESSWHPANESVAPGLMTFALAETFDPNMLAAWGTRGVSADVIRAKSLYLRARDLGVARAQMRLDQLR